MSNNTIVPTVQATVDAALSTTQDNSSTQPNNAPVEVVVPPAISAAGLQKSRLEQMSRLQRQQLTQGQLVELIGIDQRTNARNLVATLPVHVVRASFRVVDQQLTTLQSQGISLRGVRRIVVTVTTKEGLKAIVNFLQFSIRDAHGALGQMKAIPNDQNPLYRQMRLREVATAVGFRHIVDMMDSRIKNTFYRGPSRSYSLPINDAKLIWKSTVTTPSSTYLKQKLVESVTAAYLDQRLNNNEEVEKLMGEIPVFGQAVNAEEARLKQTKNAEDAKNNTYKKEKINQKDDAKQKVTSEEKSNTAQKSNKAKKA